MIARLLFALTARLPCRLIAIGEQPYLERYYVGQVLGITAYLHRFVRADDERQVHDHPWRWAVSLILAGGYLEERVTALCPDRGWLVALRRMRPGHVNTIGPGDFHRITKTRPETWTLFVHGARFKSWGFYERLEGIRTIVYHQPLDAASSAAWYRRAPPGRDAGREPFGGTTDAPANAVR